MKQSSTLFLKAVVILIGLIVLVLCVFVLPSGLRSDTTGMYKPLLMGMYIPAIPFFIGLFQILKLLGYIETNRAFSKESVKSLSYIKYCGFVIGGLYAFGLPYIFNVASQDDAPGVLLIGFIFTFAATALALFAAILQKLLQNVLDIKLENELTV